MMGLSDFGTRDRGCSVSSINLSGCRVLVLCMFVAAMPEIRIWQLARLVGSLRDRSVWWFPVSRASSKTIVASAMPSRRSSRKCINMIL